MTTTTRRGFLATGAAATAAAVIPTAVHASVDETIKVGVIGCGGRGTGACGNALNADKQVKIVAAGDAFPDKLGSLRSQLKKYGDRVDLGDRAFSGLDAYEKVLKCDLDYVILATPPGFRPVHLKMAVDAKKNIFCEKPVAVDAPGIRQVLSLVDQVKANKTALVAGTQRRHQAGYLETVKRIHDGEIGDIVAGRCAWNGQSIWFHPRKPGTPDVAYELNNWYHFLWLCGDHIVEQHVHNLDVINWVLNAHPVKAVGFGGRTANNPSRPAGPPKEVGNIWDHFAIEYEYPNGVHISSYCTHLPGVKSDVSETVYGTKGNSPGELVHDRQEESSRSRPDRCVRSGTHRPDSEHPGREAVERIAERRGEHDDRDPGSDCGLHGQGNQVGGNAEVGSVHHAPAPDDGNGPRRAAGAGAGEDESLGRLINLEAPAESAGDFLWGTFST